MLCYYYVAYKFSCQPVGEFLVFFVVYSL